MILSCELIVSNVSRCLPVCVRNTPLKSYSTIPLKVFLAKHHVRLWFDEAPLTNQFTASFTSVLSTFKTSWNLQVTPREEIASEMKVNTNQRADCSQTNQTMCEHSWPKVWGINNSVIIWCWKFFVRPIFVAVGNRQNIQKFSWSTVLIIYVCMTWWK